METQTNRHYRFGTYEVDAATGELRRKGIRVRLHAQPSQLLLLFLARPGELLTREEICRALWPEETFVDFEHGVNSAINRLREALRDSAANPRFIETLARRGYRFVAPVEVISSPGSGIASTPQPEDAASTTLKPRIYEKYLATPQELPQTSHRVVKVLFIAFQLMYAGFYVGALANLAEIEELLSVLPRARAIYILLIVTAGTLIPARAFMLNAVLMRAPNGRTNLLRLWRFLFPMDLLWALAPFLLLHHMNFGLALACTTLLIYAPFAQRSLILMGACAGRREAGLQEEPKG